MLNIMYTSGGIFCGTGTTIHLLREDNVPICARELPCQRHRLWYSHLDVIHDPAHWEFKRQWSLRNIVYELDIRNIQRAGSLADYVPDAAAIDSLRSEIDFIRHVDVIVMVMNTTRRYVPQAQRGLRRLSADLRFVGRLDVPMVFQLNFRDANPDDPDPDRQLVSLDEIKRTFTWPRCDYVEAYPPRGFGVRETLNRALELHEEAKAERGAAERAPGS